ncbi:RNA polymerase sigma factor [Olivibacter domesticus]|uniref:RNA polymerase sigma factor, sigma-70 family n=1 Tax=Olivibacter domesticus TaxID=407022 RepID=A0A1H7JPH3_OLID1|nr:sigma-70 family RNA polymerase sigma factor [Olivibacter domesticus]SEK76334.1 RNA polymerase sigma factor, sigma-70 family [Olivibacter domesticus]
MAWQKLDSETTEDLVTYIGWIGDPGMREQGQDAFQAFCFRFQADIVKKCRIISRNRGYDKHVADDIAQRTFERFFKYPRFDFSKSKAKDYDTGIKLYLYRIAENLFNDFYSEQHNPNSNPYEGDEDLVYEFPSIENMSVKPEQLRVIKEKYELVQKALERLSPKHKIIYLTYQQHAQQGFKLPRKLTEKLRTELQLTQATIQFYKKEAFDKIKEYLEIYGSK